MSRRNKVEVGNFYFINTTSKYYTEKTVLYKNEKYSVKNIIDNGGLVFVLHKGFVFVRVSLYYKGEFLDGENGSILVLENELIKINNN